MSKKVRKNKKRSVSASMIMLLKGTVMEWSVYDPLGDDEAVIDSKISNKKAHSQLQIKAITEMMQGAVTKMHLSWLGVIDVEFRDEKGRPDFRSVEMRLKGKMDDLQERSHEEIERIFDEEVKQFKGMHRYVITHMKAEILNTN